MEILRLAAFSQNGLGGNPAGVAFCDEMPSAETMMSIAKEVGYSETAFLVKQENGWRVRYFAPELEVPFCGHATIALGAALGERFGEGTYMLILNDNTISVRASKSDLGFSAALRSPSTWTKDAPEEYITRVLSAFQLKREQLDERFPVRIAGAGATHLIVFVKDRQTLADMRYPFEEVRTMMTEQDLVTISLLWQESDSVIHSRNPFAAGGVYEDPATGAAAAALAGYLREIGWKGSKNFTILQGEDMGVPSRLNVSFTSKAGDGISVSGEVRKME